MAQGPAMMAMSVPADGGVGAGKVNDRVFCLHVAADELVRLADADHFLDARHLFERAGLHFALIPGDADGGALRPGDGVSAVAQLLDFFTNRAHLLFGGVRLHHH